MTRDEHEAQQVVTHVVWSRGVEIPHAHLLLQHEVATELLLLTLEPFVPPQTIDRAMFRSGHEPGAGVVRDA